MLGALAAELTLAPGGRPPARSTTVHPRCPVVNFHTITALDDIEAQSWLTHRYTSPLPSLGPRPTTHFANPRTLTLSPRRKQSATQSWTTLAGGLWREHGVLTRWSSDRTRSTWWLRSLTTL